MIFLGFRLELFSSFNLIILFTEYAFAQSDWFRKVTEKYWIWRYERLFEAEKRFAKVFSLNSIEIDLMKLSWELIQLNIFNRHFFYLTNMNETIDYCPNQKQKLDPMTKKNKSSLKGCQLCRQELYVIWNEHNGKRYDCRKEYFSNRASTHEGTSPNDKSLLRWDSSQKRFITWQGFLARSKFSIF
jgi:hypothetical protein